MWKQRAATLGGCLAALPLLMGCANGVGGPPQAYAPPGPMATVAPDTGARVYAVGSGQPAAILVMLRGPGDMLAADPRLWVAQGFDVVTPIPPEIDRIAADQEATAARLIAQVQTLADAPVWLVGTNPAIQAAMAAMPPSGAGGVSGVVVTSTTSGAGTCSERMIYSSAGNGAPPKVSVTKSGDACPAGSPLGAGISTMTAPPMPPVPPAVHPSAPRLIETSLPTSSPAARQTAVRQVAELIKTASPD